ncbi:ATP-dependent sacrificial sulfur transferase LarE [Desulfolutivibrio sulfoxidireducens]|uniref:ATP-dependent sacrificial sulfur transferase LarE n=1 Tax=Desulfolutivibrio sulfoxidireducens TaxID=2773299 RepID=UPI00159D82E0|nr:ATP-dependent sacrificial sulfur transferase LarE [Desulfolutivibrio sulfoxidireducens]QLA20127.1 hypothetical protein GD604_10560 [Desulfolutivibrio sulfoxidireducens]
MMPTDIQTILAGYGSCVAAVSGGVDSLLLAVVAHRTLGRGAILVHAASPAVPAGDAARLRRTARDEGFAVREVDAGEMRDPRYLQNPVDRCYHCKSHLYAALAGIARDAGAAAIISGTNRDDLSDYRPGLVAAREAGVRHPFVEAGMDKAAIRAMARSMGLCFADIPASPCLGSRIHTGTVITRERLAAVDAAEELVRRRCGLPVVRCRIEGDAARIEVAPEILHDPGMRAGLEAAVAEIGRVFADRFPFLATVELDPRGYARGRAFVGKP